MRILQFYFYIVLYISFFSPIKTNWNTKDYLKRVHTLTHPFTDKWFFVGSSMAINSIVRLTPDQQSRKGGVWNHPPCLMHNWEIQMHFKIHGSGTTMYGDGMAIWYTKEKGVLGNVFGSMNKFFGLGVFLDTYSNELSKSQFFPKISLMVNNGSLEYNHENDGGSYVIDGCSKMIRGSEYETYLSIKYHNNILTISTDVDGKGIWSKCISVKGVNLPTDLFFGITAATGEVSDTHDILSFKVYDITLPSDVPSIKTQFIQPSINNPQFYFKTDTETEEPSYSGLYVFLLIISSIVVVIFVCIIGYFAYNNYHSSRRFY